MVVDEADLCPDTPGGLDVDSDGCNSQHCLETVATEAGTCSVSVLARSQHCYVTDGAACPFDDVQNNEALLGLRIAVEHACGSASSVQAAGYGAALETEGLVRRVQEACLGSATSLAARSYGGPHAKLRAGAAANGRACLDAAYDHAESLVTDVYDIYRSCIFDAMCDRPGLAVAEANRATLAAASIEAACVTAGTTLANELGSPADLFIQRAVNQAHCQAAASLGDTSSLPLRCGPNDVRLANVVIRDANREPVATPLSQLPRGVPFQAILDNEAWGTRCGDGSEYAIWFRLAPDGALLHDVLTHMEGGGVCITHADCVSRGSTYLFRSLDNRSPSDLRGYMADRPENPFQDVTLMFQPYCTQDIFAGGGTVETGTPPYGGPLYRYGAINARASMDFLRDLLWLRMDAEDSEGYRPDRIRALFGGTSAGGFGTLSNYAYPLDELRWIHTLANDHVSIGIAGGVPDIRDLGTAKQESWNTRPYMPPYCNDVSRCIQAGEIMPAHAERLGGSPWQELLTGSPQNDNVQQSTQGFQQPPLTQPSGHINGVRDFYCRNRANPHLHFYLPPNLQPEHGFINDDEIYDPAHAATYDPLVADGEFIFDWLRRIYDDPDSALDRVAEGDLTSTITGVVPFPCDIGDGPGSTVDYDPTPNPTSTVGCRVDGIPGVDQDQSCSYVADGAGVFESTSPTTWVISVDREGQTVELAGGTGIMGCSIPGCPQELRTGTILSRDGETVTVTIRSTTTALGGTYGFVAAGGPSAGVFGGGTP